MAEISYSCDTEVVDWTRLKRDLHEDEFDNGRTPEELQRSFENSAVCAFALHDGRVIGTARALSDGVCNAYVVDVWTRSDFRRQGIGRRMMQLLEEKLPGQHIYLFTDGMESFYEAAGYQGQGTGLGKVVGRWLNRF